MANAGQARAERWADAAAAASEPSALPMPCCVPVRPLISGTLLW
jgi:hypothetical protein